MALTSDENFGTVVPGFVTDDDGRLVVSDAAGSQALENQFRLNQQTGIQTIARRESTLANLVLTDGTMRITALGAPLKAGTTYSSVDVYSGTAPSSSLTHSWVCLLDLATMTTIRCSNDDTSEWTANTKRTFTLSTPYTPTTDVEQPGLGIIAKATTTLPTVWYLSTATPAGLLNESPRIALGSTGHVAPVANGTVLTVVNGTVMWNGTLY